jgi:hypothetical protein
MWHLVPKANKTFLVFTVVFRDTRMFLTDVKSDASECFCLDQYALIRSRSVRGIPRNAIKQYQTCEPVRVCSTPAVFHVTFTHRVGRINIYTYTQKKTTTIRDFTKSSCILGQAVAQLVETLRYKPEDRGFDSRRCQWIFSLT